MADNFNMKQFLTENKLGPYSKIKETQEADTQAEKMMDFLSEKDKAEENTINEYVGSELSLEIGQWVIDNYPAVADVLKAEPFGDGQEIVDLGNAVVGLATAGTLTLGAGLVMFGDSIVKAVKDAASKLKLALSKVGSSKPSAAMAEIYEDMRIDPELMSIAAKIKAKGMAEEKTEEALGGKNPEGDKLVLRFLQGVAKRFDYPVAKAAIFVKDTIKSLGY